MTYELTLCANLNSNAEVYVAPTRLTVVACGGQMEIDDPNDPSLPSPPPFHLPSSSKVKTLFGYPLPLLPRPQIIAVRSCPSSLCALRCRRSRWSGGRARCVRVGLDTENGSVACAVVVAGREVGPCSIMAAEKVSCNKGLIP